MKTLLLLFALAFAPLAIVGCANISPQVQAVGVQTLLAVGHTAEIAVQTSATLYRDGKISGKQARDIADYYDSVFQPAFRIAKDAVLGNMGAVAPENVVKLARGLTAMVAKLQAPNP